SVPYPCLCNIADGAYMKWAAKGQWSRPPHDRESYPISDLREDWFMMRPKGGWRRLGPWRGVRRVIPQPRRGGMVGRSQHVLLEDNVLETLPRALRLFIGIDQANGVGLEIGALDKPAALPSAGRIYYADYASTDELRLLHSATPAVNADQLVNVDFVFGERL